MAHKHSVYDTDSHFVINPMTRVIKDASSIKTTIIQHDHNSERFTFEIPRYVEGHDMSICDVVEVHYSNIGTGTARKEGVYTVTDMQLSPDDENVVIMSWLISHNATQLVGSLNFLLRFACTSNGEVEYVWNTAIFSGISVSSGIYNSDVVVEDYADVLKSWENQLQANQIIDIRQTYYATKDGEKNIWTVTFGDGRISNFEVANGHGSESNVNKGNLTLGIASDGLIYIFVDGTPIGTGIPQGQSGDVFGYVDENNTVVLNGNLTDGTYTIKYEMENGKIVDIGNMVLDDAVHYSIASTLTNCTINNNAKTIADGDSYSAIITANSGYELKSVTVTMGGQSVSVSGGSISIANVTGNIVITAVAEEKAVEPTYKNLLPSAIDTDGSSYNGGKGYKSGYKISTSSGSESATTGAYCSGFMPISSIYDVIRVKNVTLSDAANVNNFAFYDANKTKIDANSYLNGTAGAFHISVDEVNGCYEAEASQVYPVGTNVAFFRFSCGGITDDTIVTVNEEIV